MKNFTLTPQTADNNTEIRLVARSLMLLALLTAILYLRVFISTILSALDAGGRGGIGLLSVIFLIIAIAGLLLTWRWEGIGGLMTLVSGAGLAVVTYFISPNSPWLSAFFYGSPFIITGGLCLVCWHRARSSTS
jgi:hypothetical protein